ncbi:MAG: Ig-like domain-containing protein [Gammaproteobacteria bacterium]|nr:Ig-like domain-containing protein [Gammaproteobacteria bacterium]
MNYLDSSGNLSPTAQFEIYYDTNKPNTWVSALNLTTDTGLSSIDHITRVAQQKLMGQINKALSYGEYIQVSQDGGTNWTNLPANIFVAPDRFELDMTLALGQGSVLARVAGANGNYSADFALPYTVTTVNPLTANFQMVPEVSAVGFNASASHLLSYVIPSGNRIHFQLSHGISGNFVEKVSQLGNGNLTSYYLDLTYQEADALSDGVINIKAQNEDLAGNYGPIYESSFLINRKISSIDLASDSGLQQSFSGVLNARSIGQKIALMPQVQTPGSLSNNLENDILAIGLQTISSAMDSSAVLDALNDRLFLGSGLNLWIGGSASNGSTVLVREDATQLLANWHYQSGKLTFTLPNNRHFSASDVQLIEKNISFSTTGEALVGVRKFSLVHTDLAGNISQPSLIQMNVVHVLPAIHTETEYSQSAHTMAVLPALSSEDYIQANNIPNMAKDLTFSTWINLQKLPQSLNNIPTLIMGMVDSSYNNKVSLSVNNNGALVFIYSVSGVSSQTPLTTNGFIQSGEWAHLGLTLSSTGLVKLYKNGNLSHSTQINVNANMSYGLDTLRIGEGVELLAPVLNAYVRDTRVYNQVLTSSQLNRDLSASIDQEVLPNLQFSLAQVAESLTPSVGRPVYNGGTYTTHSIPYSLIPDSEGISVTLANSAVQVKSLQLEITNVADWVGPNERLQVVGSDASIYINASITQGTFLFQSNRWGWTFINQQTLVFNKLLNDEKVLATRQEVADLMGALVYRNVNVNPSPIYRRFAISLADDFGNQSNMVYSTIDQIAPDAPEVRWEVQSDESVAKDRFLSSSGLLSVKGVEGSTLIVSVGQDTRISRQSVTATGDFQNVVFDALSITPLRSGYADLKVYTEDSAGNIRYGLQQQITLDFDIPNAPLVNNAVLLHTNLVNLNLNGVGEGYKAVLVLNSATAITNYSQITKLPTNTWQEINLSNGAINASLALDTLASGTYSSYLVDKAGNFSLPSVPISIGNGPVLSILAQKSNPVETVFSEDGHLEVGDKLIFSVKFYENINFPTVAGTLIPPYLAFNLGGSAREAYYDPAKSSANKLVFSYTIVASDASSVLGVVPVSTDSDAIKLRINSFLSGEISGLGILLHGPDMVVQSSVFQVVSTGTGDTSPPRVKETYLMNPIKSALAYDGDPFYVDYQLSEPVSGLSKSDFTVTGGTVESLQGQGANYRLKVLPTPNADLSLGSIHLATGTYTDLSGNSNTESSKIEFYADTRGPEITVVAGAQAKIYQNTTYIGKAAASSGGLTITVQDKSQLVKLTDSNYDVLVHLSTSNRGVNDVPIVRSLPLQFNLNAGQIGNSATISLPALSQTDLNLLGDGSLQVTVFSTDVVGNVSSQSTSVVLDVTAPSRSISLDYPLTNFAGYTTNPSLTIYGVDTGNTWQYQDNGASWVTGGDNNVLVSTEGSHVYILRQLDLAGNASPESTYLLTLDTKAQLLSAKLVQDTGSDSSDALSYSNVVAVSGLEADGKWSYKIGATGAYVTVAQGTLFTAKEGGYTYYLKQTDKFGNTSAESSVTLTIDTSPPILNVSLLASKNNGVTINNARATDANGLFRIVSEPGSSLNAQIVSPNSTIHTKVPVPVSGTFNWVLSQSDLATLGVGLYSLSVSVTDSAGNLNRIDNGLSVQVDNSAGPAVDLDANTSGIQTSVTANYNLLWSQEVLGVNSVKLFPGVGAIPQSDIAKVKVLANGSFNVADNHWIINGASSLSNATSYALNENVTDTVTLGGTTFTVTTQSGSGKGSIEFSAVVGGSLSGSTIQTILKALSYQAKNLQQSNVYGNRNFALTLEDNAGNITDISSLDMWLDNSIELNLKNTASWNANSTNLTWKYGGGAALSLANAKVVAGNFTVQDYDLPQVNFGISGSSGFSFEFWLNVRAHTLNQDVPILTIDGGTSKMYLSSNYTSANADAKLAFASGYTGTPSFRLATTSTVPKGRWSHVAVTVESNGIAKIYLDGVLDSTGTVGSTTLASWASSLRTPSLGGLATSVNIDVRDLRLYSTVLTANQVNSDLLGNISRLATGGYEASLLAVYGFNNSNSDLITGRQGYSSGSLAYSYTSNFINLAPSGTITSSSNISSILVSISGVKNANAEFIGVNIGSAITRWKVGSVSGEQYNFTVNGVSWNINFSNTLASSTTENIYTFTPSNGVAVTPSVASELIKVLGYQNQSENVLLGSRLVNVVVGTSSGYSIPQQVVFGANLPALGIKLQSDTGLLNDDGITNNPTIEVSGISLGSTWQYQVDNTGSWTSGTGSTFTATNSGTHTYAVRQFNNNAELTSLTTPLQVFDLTEGQWVPYKIIIDTTPPTGLVTNFSIVDSGKSATDYITNRNQITVNSSKVSDSGVNSQSAFYIEFQYKSPGGNWNGTWLTSRQSIGFFGLEGSYIYKARAVDTTGNGVSESGQTFSTFSVTIDTTPPAPVTATLATDTGIAGDGITTNNTVVISGLENDGSWYYTIDSTNVKYTGVGSTFLATSGIHTYQIFHNDVAGNLGALTSVAVNYTRINPTTIDFNDLTAGIQNTQSLDLSAGGVINYYGNAVKLLPNSNLSSNLKLVTKLLVRPSLVQKLAASGVVESYQLPDNYFINPDLDTLVLGNVAKNLNTVAGSGIGSFTSATGLIVNFQWAYDPSLLTSGTLGSESSGVSVPTQPGDQFLKNVNPLVAERFGGGFIISKINGSAFTDGELAAIGSNIQFREGSSGMDLPVNGAWRGFQVFFQDSVSIQGISYNPTSYASASSKSVSQAHIGIKLPGIGSSISLVANDPNITHYTSDNSYGYRLLQSGSMNLPQDLTGIGSSLTLGAWIKPSILSTVVGNNGTAIRNITIFDFGNAVNNSNTASDNLVLSLVNSGGVNQWHFQFEMFRGATSLGRFVADSDITLDRWDHIAVTLDSNQVKLYQNANLVGSYTVDSSSLNSITRSLSTSYIGKSNWNTNSINFEGGIANVKVYASALSRDQILADYQSKVTNNDLLIPGSNARSLKMGFSFFNDGANTVPESTPINYSFNSGFLGGSVDDVNAPAIVNADLSAFNFKLVNALTYDVNQTLAKIRVSIGSYVSNTFKSIIQSLSGDNSLSNTFIFDGVSFRVTEKTDGSLTLRPATGTTWSSASIQKLIRGIQVIVESGTAYDGEAALDFQLTGTVDSPYPFNGFQEDLRYLPSAVYTLKPALPLPDIEVNNLTPGNIVNSNVTQRILVKNHQPGATVRYQLMNDVANNNHWVDIGSDSFYISTGSSFKVLQQIGNQISDIETYTFLNSDTQLRTQVQIESFKLMTLSELTISPGLASDVLFTGGVNVNSGLNVSWLKKATTREGDPVFWLALSHERLSTGVSQPVLNVIQIAEGALLGNQVSGLYYYRRVLTSSVLSDVSDAQLQALNFGNVVGQISIPDSWEALDNAIADGYSIKNVTLNQGVVQFTDGGIFSADGITKENKLQLAVGNSDDVVSVSFNEGDTWRSVSTSFNGGKYVGEISALDGYYPAGMILVKVTSNGVNTVTYNARPWTIDTYPVQELPTVSTLSSGVVSLDEAFNGFLKLSSTSSIGKVAYIEIITIGNAPVSLIKKSIPLDAISKAAVFGLSQSELQLLQDSGLFANKNNVQLAIKYGLSDYAGNLGIDSPSTNLTFDVQAPSGSPYINIAESPTNIINLAQATASTGIASVLGLESAGTLKVTFQTTDSSGSGIVVVKTLNSKTQSQPIVLTLAEVLILGKSRDGVIGVSTQQIDAAGNQGPQSDRTEFLLDATSPTVPSLTFLGTQSHIHLATLSAIYSINPEPDTQLNIKFWDAYGHSYFIQNLDGNTIGLTQASLHSSNHLGGLVDGEIQVLVSSYDIAGNVTSVNRSFQLDATAKSPVMDAQSLVAGARVNLTVAEAGTLYLVSDAISVTQVSSITSANTSLWKSVIVGANDRVVNISTDGLGSGSYLAYEVDSYGNLSAGSSSKIRIVTPPTLEISGHQADGSLVSGSFRNGDILRLKIKWSDDLLLGLDDGDGSQNLPVLEFKIGNKTRFASLRQADINNALNLGVTNNLSFEYTLIDGDTSSSSVSVTVANDPIKLGHASLIENVSKNSAVLQSASLATTIASLNVQLDNMDSVAPFVVTSGWNLGKGNYLAQGVSSADLKFYFNEAISGLQATDFVVKIDGIIQQTSTLVGSENVYTLSIPGQSLANKQLEINLPANSFQDTAGNSNGQSYTQNYLIRTLQPPQIMAGNNDLVFNSTQILSNNAEFLSVKSSAGDNIIVNLSNALGSLTKTIVANGMNQPVILGQSDLDTLGHGEVMVSANARDSFNNQSVATSLKVNFLLNNPTVTSISNGYSGVVTNNLDLGSNPATVSYGFNFSTPVKNLQTSDFNVANGSVQSLTISQDQKTATLTVSPSLGVEGNLQVTLQSNSYTDLANNSNLSVASSTPILMDTRRPTLSSIHTSSGSINTVLRAGDLVYVDVVWSEPVITTQNADTLSSVLLSLDGVQRVASYQSGIGTDTLRYAYTIQNGDVSSSGIKVNDFVLTSTGITPPTFTDLRGNVAHIGISPQMNNTSLQVDALGPNFLLNNSPLETNYVAALKTFTGGTAKVVLSFTEAITGLELSDLVVSTVNSSGQVLSPQLKNLNSVVGGYEVTVTNLLGSGTVSVGLTANSVLDLNSNFNATITNGFLFNHTLDLGSVGGVSLGKLSNGVQVGGNWYYFWDKSGDGAVSYSDVNTGGSNRGDTVTYSELSALISRNYTIGGSTFKLEIPSITTNPNPPDFASDVRILPTIANGQGINPNTANSGLAAVWDAFNGTKTNPIYNYEGVPPNWAGQGNELSILQSYYWTNLAATTLGGENGHAVAVLGTGLVLPKVDTDYYYAALKVIPV